MKTLAPTKQHRMLPVELLGDTLIVAPRGDAAGFSPSECRVEISRIGKLLDAPSVRHLVVDLGAARYYGPSVIHPMIAFGEQIAARGGRVAFCEASDDMLEGLRIHRLDPDWLEFGSRQQATRNLATVPFEERLRRYAPGLASAAVALVLALLVIFRPWDNRDVKDYQTYVAIWTEMQELRSSNPTESEVADFADRARRQLVPIIERLERTATTADMGKRRMLWAGRDHLLHMLHQLEHQPDGEWNPYRVETCTYEMEAARRFIEQTNRFEIRLPRWPAAGVEHVHSLRERNRLAQEVDRI